MKEILKQELSIEKSRPGRRGVRFEKTQKHTIFGHCVIPKDLHPLHQLHSV